MRKAAVLLLLAGCGDLIPDLYKDERELKSFGLAPEDMDAPPGEREIAARVVSDAHAWRTLPLRLNEGRAGCAEVTWVEGRARCARDDDELQVVHFPGEGAEVPGRVEETGYYCHEESLYYYHYTGGPEKWDVWMGPFKVTWNRVKKE